MNTKRNNERGGAVRGLLVLIGLIVVIVAIISVATKKNDTTGGTSSTSTSTPDTSTSAPTDNSAPAPTAAPTPPPAPVTIFTASGGGQKTTAKFDVPDEWVLNWSYDCSNFGGQGNFQVYEYNGDGTLINIAVNELGPKGSGTNNFHADSGSRYLEMNSECKWTVQVVG